MRQPKILLLNDEEDILRSLEYFLAGEGYNVSTASSGKSALSTAEAMHPDLAILDVRMPGMDGIEVCRKLRKSSLCMAKS